MDKHSPNKNVVHPQELLHKERVGVTKFNNSLAVKITRRVGSMWSAYLFALLSLTSLPAILVAINPDLRQYFPAWIVTGSIITLIAWISQNFLQLVLLPVIMVGQNVIQGHQEAKAESDHKALTYLVNLQEEQMAELKSHRETLEYLKKKL